MRGRHYVDRGIPRTPGHTFTRIIQPCNYYDSLLEGSCQTYRSFRVSQNRLHTPLIVFSFVVHRDVNFFVIWPKYDISG